MKRIVCILLAAITLLTMIPVTTFAAQQENEDGWIVKSTINDENIETVHWVDVYINRKGFQYWLVITVSDKDHLYYYESAKHIKIFGQANIKEIAYADPNLKYFYPVIEQYLLALCTQEFYEDNLAGMSDQQIALSTLETLYEDWIVEWVADTATEAYLGVVGTVFTPSHVLSTLYSETGDLVDAVLDVGDTLGLEGDFWEWARIIFTLLFVIDKNRPTQDQLVNIVTNQTELEEKAIQSELEMHRVADQFALEHCRLIQSKD